MGNERQSVSCCWRQSPQREQELLLEAVTPERARVVVGGSHPQRERVVVGGSHPEESVGAVGGSHHKGTALVIGVSCVSP